MAGLQPASLLEDEVFHRHFAKILSKEHFLLSYLLALWNYLIAWF